VTRTYSRRLAHAHRLTRSPAHAPSPFAGARSPALGRQPAAPNPRALAALQRAYGNRAVQRLLEQGRPALPAPGGGRPLPRPVLGSMQRAFGADLSGVRVAESPGVASLGAHAVTQGQHIHFAPGQMRLGETGGQKLLAHELTHVLQQRAGRPAAQPKRQPDFDNHSIFQDTPPLRGSMGEGLGVGAAEYSGASPAYSINLPSSGRGGGMARLQTSPALEAEADRLGALAARGASVGHLGVSPAAGAQPMIVGDVVSLAAAAGISLGALLTWAWDRGWAYALGETLQAQPNAEPEGAPFVSSVEQQKQAFITAVMARGDGQMTAEAAEALYRQQVQAELEDRDEVTGFVGAGHRKPTLDNALVHVRRQPEASAFYVEADVRNLGGLNAHLGHSGANLIYRQLAQTAERHLRRLSGEVHAFRHGGDEISFVIVGQQSSLTLAAVENALLAADVENHAYAQAYTFLSQAPYAKDKRLAIAEIPHLKYAGKSGAGLIWAVAQARPDLPSADAVITQADQLVEVRKKLAGEFSAPDPLYTLTPSQSLAEPELGGSSTMSTLVKLAWSAGIEMTTLVRWAWDKGWEYAYDQVFKYTEVQSASQAYLASAEQQKEEFLRAAVGLSGGKLSRAEAEALYDRDVRAFVEARDVVTGFQGARHRLPTVRNALAYVQQNPDARAFYIEADVRNLSGLNAHLGHNNADTVYQRLAKTAEERLKTLPGQLHAFRHGGDEISFVVVGPRDDLSLAEVEAALASAARDNLGYAASAAFTSLAPDSKGQRIRLRDVPHPKYKGQRGTGLIHAVAEIAPDRKDFNDIIRAAERRVESRKLGID
jgi:GGDEF domain-containing protein